MKTVSDLSDYIKKELRKTSIKRRPAKIEKLANQIINDPHMSFLLFAMSSHTKDETKIRMKIADILAAQDNQPGVKEVKKDSGSVDRYLCFDTYLPCAADGPVESFCVKEFDEERKYMPKDTERFIIDPESFGGTDYPDVVMGGPYSKDYKAIDLGPIATPEQELAIQELYQQAEVKDQPGGVWTVGQGLTDGFDTNSAWIQTYSGRRFNPINPNPKAIVIQDIAHALSMQCRFSGHCQEFYSVAQHSVLVSYLCGEDALWGLLHDASEAYLVDVPRPLKRSGKFQAYLEIEDVMQKAICKRFGLAPEEPASVKRADKVLLATEARDLMSPLHPDWRQPMDPLPLTITPWTQKEAETNFIRRFDALMAERLSNISLSSLIRK